MDDFAASLSHLLSNVILPNLKAVQTSQAEQIAANDRLEEAVGELEFELKAQFANLSAQITACRAEVASLQAALKVAQTQNPHMFYSTSTTIN
jgi:predicted  nucleic acid-binding Zn-ribbon protein